MAQNVVLTRLEIVVVKKLLSEGLLKKYNRWVDDTFCRHRVADREKLLKALNGFHPKIQFTQETVRVS